VKARVHRLKLIERLIQDKHVSNQEQLQSYLQEEGCLATQATLSRDLRYLQVWRSVDTQGHSRYMLSQKNGAIDKQETQIDVVRGCLSLSFASQMAIFRTLEGFAPSFGLAIEHLAMDEVLGVLSGYDTVFVALQDGVNAAEFRALLKKKVPSIKIKD
jgi:transcriptional regulator of arginine metabolism